MSCKCMAQAHLAMTRKITLACRDCDPVGLAVYDKVCARGCPVFERVDRWLVRSRCCADGNMRQKAQCASKHLHRQDRGLLMALPCAHVNQYHAEAIRAATRGLLVGCKGYRAEVLGRHAHACIDLDDSAHASITAREPL